MLCSRQYKLNYAESQQAIAYTLIRFSSFPTVFFLDISPKTNKDYIPNMAEKRRNKNPH